MHNIFSSTLFYRITYDSFCFINDKDRNVRQIRFHVCIKMRRCKRRVKERHFSDNLIRTAHGPTLQTKHTEQNNPLQGRNKTCLDLRNPTMGNSK